MPQNDRYRKRVVPIEYEDSETFTVRPQAERVTLVLVAGGIVSLILNGHAVTLEAPCVLLLSDSDVFQVADATRLSARSFSFYPGFVNSSLTFEALRQNRFTTVEDEHDRNMIEMFLCRDDLHKGYLDVPSQIFVRLSEWMDVMGYETNAQSDGYWTCRIRRYLLQALYLINDLYMDQAATVNKKIKKSPVNMAMEYIHINYQNSMTLQNICAFVNCNRTTLNHDFRRQNNRAVMEYLLWYRLKIACEALDHTNLTLAEIAEATGFKYDTYFIKQFKAKMEMTPSQYRHQKRERRKPTSR